jgi:hypothetical protein
MVNQGDVRGWADVFQKQPQHLLEGTRKTTKTRGQDSQSLSDLVSIEYKPDALLLG